MFKPVAAAILTGAVVLSLAPAQSKKPAASKSVSHDLTVRADEVYTGTMELAVDRGKVTGNMRLTAPTEIVGKVAGTTKQGVMTLAFPYRMTERNCEGNVKMTITVPSTPGPANGTMEATGCGNPSEKVAGTVELKPAAPAKK